MVLRTFQTSRATALAQEIPAFQDCTAARRSVVPHRGDPEAVLTRNLSLGGGRLVIAVMGRAEQL